MSPLFGFGGIRMETMIDGEPVNVTIPKRLAYCSPPEIEPVGWEAVTINDKELQVIDGYHFTFRLTVENVSSGDEELIALMARIINHSYASKAAVTFYPKYVSNSLVNRFWEVIPASDWEPIDLNTKRAVAQRIELTLKTAVPVEDI